MTRRIREVGPLAIVVGVACAVTLYLLGTNPSLGRWILAALLFAHGWVHLMFVFPKPPPPKGEAPASATAWPFDLGASWLLVRAGLPAGAVQAIGRALVVIAFAGFLLAALATAGVLVPAAWWAGLGLVGAASSALLLGIAFSPTLLLGFAIDIAVTWLVLAGPWTRSARRRDGAAAPTRLRTNNALVVPNLTTRATIDPTGSGWSAGTRWPPQELQMQASPFPASVLREPSPDAACTCEHWIHCNCACHTAACDSAEATCDVAYLADDGGLTPWGCPDCTPGEQAPHWLGCELIGWHVPVQRPIGPA